MQYFDFFSLWKLTFTSNVQVDIDGAETENRTNRADALVQNTVLQHSRLFRTSWASSRSCAFTTYHDDPSRLLCGAHAHYGRHANGGPLEVHPTAGRWERRRRITESPSSAKIPPYYFQSCVSANVKQRSRFQCLRSRHLQV